jgi:hypothetical protein
MKNLKVKALYAWHTNCARLLVGVMCAAPDDAHDPLETF